MFKHYFNLLEANTCREGGKNEKKNVFEALQAQILEYLTFEYLMPSASQLHLQCHVIQVLSRRKQAT
jgi:hypothetical protein